MDTTEQVLCAKGDFVLFNRNKKVRVGKIISKGSKSIGLEVANMSSNTKIPTETPLQLVQVWVTVDVAKELGFEVE
jgi:hypothetical protein